LVGHENARVVAKLAQHVLASHPAHDDDKKEHLHSTSRAVRLLLARALRTSAEQIPHEQISKLQTLFHPNLDDEDEDEDEGRMEACMSVRVFRVPKALCLLGSDFGVSVCLSVCPQQMDIA
jgi:hypothetical protein